MIIFDPTVILFQAPTNIANLLRREPEVFIPKTFVDVLTNPEYGYAFIDEISDVVHYLRPTELVDLILPFLSIYFRRVAELREPFARLQSQIYLLMQSYPLSFADELFEIFPSLLRGWYSHFSSRISKELLFEHAWRDSDIIEELKEQEIISNIFDDIMVSLPKLLSQILLEELSFLMVHSRVIYRTKLTLRLLWQKTRLLVAEFGSKALDFVLKLTSKLDETIQKIKNKKRELIDKYRLRGIIWLVGIILWWKTGIGNIPILVLEDP